MKIFTTEDIRSIEKQTIQSTGTSEAVLINRVAEAVATEIATKWRPSKRVVIFAGPGNNGADALVTAMQLIERNFNPVIYLFNIHGDSIKPSCRTARDKMRAEYSGAELHEVTGTFNMPELGANDLVIDGLFGSGLREPLSGGFMAVVRYINESGAHIVSIDVPSGLFGEWNNPATARNIIHANLTLAIQFPRIAFFLRSNAELVGRWKVLDIGFSREAIEKQGTKFHMIEEAEIRGLLRQRPIFSSKADFGSACIIAGRYGMAGAAVLATKGALRAGAGKVTLFSPQCTFPIIQSTAPEVLFEPDGNKLTVSDIRFDHEYDAIGIGPGIGTHDATINAVDAFLRHSSNPLVIDADALNCIAARPTLLNHIPPLSVLTPHAGEFDRLFGSHDTDDNRLIKALEISRRYNILILLKGRYTALVRPDGKIYFNSSGTPAMATAGSGDVLTGIITSLMAQGYKPEVSALLGAFIHGRAGEMAAAVHGDYGVTATDIAENTGKAIAQIMQQNTAVN